MSYIPEGTERSDFLLLSRENLKTAREMFDAYQAGAPEVLDFVANNKAFQDKNQVTLTDFKIAIASSNVSQNILDIEHLRKKAKKLLVKLKDGQKNAWERVRTYHQRGATLTPETVKLADVLHVIARENNMVSWPKLKIYSQALAEFNNMDVQKQGFDEGFLHVRPGTDIQNSLEKAGFKGRFGPLRDIYLQGTLRGGDKKWGDFTIERAKFLAREFHLPMGKDEKVAKEYILKGYREENEVFETAFAGQDVEEICLWFEHDTHDQISLSSFFFRYQAAQSKIPLCMISPSQMPGLKKFLGLGVLDGPALRFLWERNRQAITSNEVEFGARVWEAVCSPSPEDVWAIAQLKSAKLPHMPAALRWHLANLPDRHSGLSALERRILDVLSKEGELTPGQLFTLHNYEADPLPTLGDWSFYNTLDQLLEASRPAIQYLTYDGSQPRHKQGTVSLTSFGRKLYEGKANWFNDNAVDRWVGGVHIKNGQNNWHWDPETGPIYF